MNNENQPNLIPTQVKLNAVERHNLELLMKYYGFNKSDAVRFCIRQAVRIMQKESGKH